MKHLRMFIAVAVFLLTVALGAQAIHQGVVNINTASVDQIAMLPSLDVKIARNIVDFRNASGPLRSIDDLLKVKGVTRDKLDVIRGLVVLRGQTTYDPDEYMSPRTGLK